MKGINSVTVSCHVMFFTVMSLLMVVLVILVTVSHITTTAYITRPS